MFHLESASAKYQDKTVLEDITLHIPVGQKLALVGHSGSGKSTLLNLLYEQSPKAIALFPHVSVFFNILSLFHNVYMCLLCLQSLLYTLLNLLKPQKQPLSFFQALLSPFSLIYLFF